MAVCHAPRPLPPLPFDVSSTRVNLDLIIHPPSRGPPPPRSLYSITLPVNIPRGGVRIPPSVYRAKEFFFAFFFFRALTRLLPINTTAPRCGAGGAGEAGSPAGQSGWQPQRPGTWRVRPFNEMSTAWVAGRAGLRRATPGRPGHTAAGRATSLRHGGFAWLKAGGLCPKSFFSKPKGRTCVTEREHTDRYNANSRKKKKNRWGRKKK